jgi:hypothetical protein
VTGNWTGTMANRADLVARKKEIRSRIERTRRELAQEREKGENANEGRVRSLEGDLGRLMAEEYRLRLAIDQSA